MPNPLDMFWIVTFGDDAQLRVRAPNAWDALEIAARCYYDTNGEWPPIPALIDGPALTDSTRPIN